MTIIKIKILQMIGKIARLKGGGSSIVGFLDSKFKFNVLEKIDLSNVEVVYVTGTNGKTSITNIINKMYKNDNKKVISNLEGANLISGIKTSLIMNLKQKKLDVDVLLLEVDEKTVNPLSKIIPPTSIILSNFFRDQLDRYFEITMVIEEIMKVIKETKPTVYFNSQDPLLLEYLNNINTDKKSFMLNEDELVETISNNIVEIKYCPNCTEKLNYNYYHYAHIGDFYCNNCDFKAPIADLEITNLNSEKKLKLNSSNTNYILYYQESLPKYMIINLSTVLLYAQNHISEKSISKVINNFTMPKGRNNNLAKGKQKIYLNLAKNVVGMEQSIKFITDNDNKINLLIAFNDNFADGRDVSWIWDVDFLPLIEKLDQLIIIGTRKRDMELRFLYESFPVNKILIYDDFEEGIDKLLNSNKNKNYIISNYTPMEPIYKILKNKKFI